MKSADDLETAFAKINDSEVEALLAIAGGLTFTIGAEIADRALAAHLPLCSPFRETVMAGGLGSLGPDYSARLFRPPPKSIRSSKGLGQPTFQSSNHFAVQDEITEAVTIAVAPAIADAEQHRAMRKLPGSLDAWAAYQRSLWHLSKFTVEDNQIAQRFSQQAIDLDPTFAGPHRAAGVGFPADGLI
jgi:hypothetical protein